MARMRASRSSGRKPGIARDRGAVADFRHRLRRGRVAVAVDHQPRIGSGGRRRRRARARARSPSARDADIPARYGARGRPPTGRGRPARPGCLAGMVADQQERRGALGVEQVYGLRVVATSSFSPARPIRPVFRLIPAQLLATSSRKRSMPLLTIRHVTEYRYHQPVSFGEHRIMVRPRESYRPAADRGAARRSIRNRPSCAGCRTCSAIRSRSPRSIGAPRAWSIESEVRARARPAELRPRSTSRIMRGSIPFTYSSEDMPDLLRSIERQHLDPAAR